MELPAFDTHIMLGPFLLMMLVFAVIAWFAMLGGSLQLSLYLVMDDEPRYLKCLAIAILIVLINIAVFAGIYLGFGLQPWYVVTCYQLFLQVLLVMLLVRCNPVQALLGAFSHAFFSTVGTIVLAIAVFFACGSAVKGAIEKEQEAAQEKGPVEMVNPFVPTAHMANPYAE